MAPQPEENDSLNKTCLRCTDAATKPCEGCKSVSYCSPEYQQADWACHKLLCESFKYFNQPPPSPDMVRIVVFHPDEEKPRFAWARTSGPNVEDQELLGHYGDRMFYPKRTNKNAWTGQALGYHVFVHYDDNFIGSYKERNRAVASSTQGMDAVGWCGPMAVHCRPCSNSLFDEPGMEPDMGKLTHMNLQAFSHIVGYLINLENDTFQDMMQKGPKVNCVKVACKGDRDNAMPSHQIVRVPRSHPVFSGAGAISRVSERISMPVRTWKCPSAEPPLTSSKIDHMHVSLVPDGSPDGKGGKTAHFGWFAVRYPRRVAGTQLVASDTMQHLSIDVVAAFGDFCQWHLGAYFNKYNAEGGDQKAVAGSIKPSKQILSEITNAKWTEYLAQWKAEKEDAAAAAAVNGRRVYTPAKASSGLERMGLTEDDYERLTSILCTSLQDHLDLNKLRFGDE